jgi:hypothetical protein
MTHTKASPSALRSDFDAFLFAPIGEDGHNDGMPLSVLSALARQDIDPWEEAARLACLPSAIAIQKLSSLIPVPSHARLTRPDALTTATRLIALLPHESGSHIRSRATPPGVGPQTQAWPANYVIIYVIVMSFLLAVEWLAAHHVDARREVKTAAPLSTSTVPSSPPLNPAR